MAYVRLLSQFKQEGRRRSNPAPKGLSRQVGANKGQASRHKGSMQLQGTQTLTTNALAATGQGSSLLGTPPRQSTQPVFLPQTSHRQIAPLPCSSHLKLASLSSPEPFQDQQ